MRRSARAVHEDRLGRPADAGAPHLRVQRDAPGHRKIGRRVHIGVANAFEMAHDRHARILLHARDQALAAARHDDVDVLSHVAQHDADRFAVLRRHHLYRSLGQPCAPSARTRHW